MSPALSKTIPMRMVARADSCSPRCSTVTRKRRFHSCRRRLMSQAGESEAPRWITKASQQVALILATFDAQELVPERLKV